MQIILALGHTGQKITQGAKKSLVPSLSQQTHSINNNWESFALEFHTTNAWSMGVWSMSVWSMTVWSMSALINECQFDGSISFCLAKKARARSPFHRPQLVMATWMENERLLLPSSSSPLPLTTTLTTTMTMTTTMTSTHSWRHANGGSFTALMKETQIYCRRRNSLAVLP